MLLLLAVSTVYADTVRDSVTATNDDIHGDPGTAWSLDNYLGRLGNYGSGQYLGLRFIHVDIPSGQTIDSAFISVYCTEEDGSGDDCNVLIEGEGTAGSATFSDSTDYVNRTRTTANVEWSSIEHFTTTNWYDTPDIQAVVEEQYELSGFDSTMVFFLDDNSSTGDPVYANRTISLNDDTPDVDISAKLIVYFSAGGGEPPASTGGRFKVHR